MLARRLIEISGVVQGVGFRPFVYQLATRHQLFGSVCNDASGVHIDVQGLSERLDRFIAELHHSAPPLSRVDQITVAEQRPHQVDAFTIVHSECENQVSVSVSPDQAMCTDCARELRDPHSRYYHYPFINCTNCGPRFSIIKQLPYDREFTSMAEFELCPDCAKAYHNPLDRRYHAQPVSCDVCGPQVTWHTPEHGQYDQTQTQTKTKQRDLAITEAAETIGQGGVIAVKGLGGFHLVCNAQNEVAVQKLRALKHRQRKPLAVMVRDVASAEQLVCGEPLEWQALSSQAAPIVLMKLRDDAQSKCFAVAPSVAPSMRYLGVMLPYTPLHLLLFDELQKWHITSLVMTSANVSGVPLATEMNQVVEQFGGQLDGVLNHNREIVNACDDSVVHFAAGAIRTLRMARGYAPYSQACEGIEHSIMAVGAQQKSSIAFAIPGQWMLSPYLGDIDDIDTQQRFIAMTDYFPSLYKTTPQQWCGDRHPGYFSTQFLHQQPGHIQTLSHHYAHLLAVMAEHRHTDSVLGFAFDGTGWGDDDTVWGGEVLVADIHGYQRVAHLRPFRLIGREQAIFEPARIVFAMLLEQMSVSEIEALALPLFRTWSHDRFTNLHRLWLAEKHSPYTSSIGRLFDGVAALIELVIKPDFEGESGLVMEQRVQLLDHRCPNDPKAVRVSDEIDKKQYISIDKEFLDHRCPNQDKAVHEMLSAQWSLIWNDQKQLDWWPMLACLVRHADSVTPQWQNQVSRRLIDELANSIVSLASNYPELTVVLSGGVFQNRQLLNRVTEQLSEQGHQWMTGKVIPVNDGGIAAGQLWYGIHHQQN